MQLSELDITTAKEKQFLQKNIDCVEKLVRFYPRKYVDCSIETGLIPDNFSICEVVVDMVSQHNGGSVPMLRAVCTETKSGSRLSVLWFRKDYLYPTLRFMIGQRVIVAGKANYSAEYNNYTITEPFVFSLDIEGAKKIYPVYSKIPRMSDEFLADKMSKALVCAEKAEQTMPEWCLSKYNLVTTPAMLRGLHNPHSSQELNTAHRTLLFQDLLYFALNIERGKRANSLGSQYNITNFAATKKVLASLPYQLTDDQRTTMRELTKLAYEGRRINALVQGDVGAGKSIIAYLTMLAMADSGYQSVLMAPTQVLARQHYEELVQLVSPLGMKVALLGGTAMKKSEKDALYKRIASGEIQFIVGTHALLNPNIQFKDLSLVIVDEEHKFGVVQREAILEKAARGVHFMSMSATPIPRSLAQVIYGDGIQLCTIKSMPNGRKPVKTIQAHNQESVFKFIKKQVAEGRQVYVVCPMIDKNEDMKDMVSVEELQTIYEAALGPDGIKMATLTGRNSKDELNEIIGEYKAGRIDVLLATTVIEVGVNVPNASVIVIHNAERFGLAGLHQLRGRVGRGMHQSYCVLFTQEDNNPRLDVMCNTTDGFKIAEEDLKLRGAGELVGVKQSGDDKYMSLMLTYPQEFEQAKRAAIEMLNSGEHQRFLDVYQKQNPSLTNEKEC